jgi:SAM-dependent methyltransferase
MDVFDDSAPYYDILYAEKDYAAECDFLEFLWKNLCTFSVQSVLDLGCGTGGHALLLAQRGYQVVGIDQSIGMITQARAKAKARSLDVEFLKKDIRNFQVHRTFDAAIAMFAVMSYQITNGDVLNTLCSTLAHLRQGGLFIFDAWFGPTVLSKRPTDRLKIAVRGNDRIYRYARPELDLLNQTVNVHYTFLRLSEKRIALEEFNERHQMRFFFPQELALLSGAAGLKLAPLIPFMKPNGQLNEEDWNVTVIGTKT